MQIDPELRKLLPHAPPMVLLESLVSADLETACCAVTVDVGMTFADADGQVPGWVGLELMAQTVAVWAGNRAKLRAGNEGAAARQAASPADIGPEMGVLLACKHYACRQPVFRRGTRLFVRVRQGARLGPMAEFECTISDGDEVVASGSVHLYNVTPEELERVLAGAGEVRAR